MRTVLNNAPGQRSDKQPQCQKNILPKESHETKWLKTPYCEKTPPGLLQHHQGGGSGTERPRSSLSCCWRQKIVRDDGDVGAPAGPRPRYVDEVSRKEWGLHQHRSGELSTKYSDSHVFEKLPAPCPRGHGTCVDMVVVGGCGWMAWIRHML